MPRRSATAEFLAYGALAIAFWGNVVVLRMTLSPAPAVTPTVDRSWEEGERRVRVDWSSFEKATRRPDRTCVPP